MPLDTPYLGSDTGCEQKLRISCDDITIASNVRNMRLDMNRDTKNFSEHSHGGHGSVGLQRRKTKSFDLQICKNAEYDTSHAKYKTKAQKLQLHHYHFFCISICLSNLEYIYGVCMLNTYPSVSIFLHVKSVG